MSAVTTVSEYIEQLPDDRKLVLKKLRDLIKKNLPKGFQECIQYGMIGYVVPHSLYPAGYHVDPKLPLPFLSLASQKNFIALYHMGIYADPPLQKWFIDAYATTCTTKLDMGKSCIRFKNLQNIPFDLIAELCQKVSPAHWINIYEKNLRATASHPKKK